MAEVNDTELQILRNAHALLNKLENDPRTRDQFQGVIKVHHPEVVTEAETSERMVKPHLEKVEALAKTLQDRLDADTAARETAASAQTEADIAAAFGRLKKDGYTDEGIEKIKSIMVDRRIPDVEAAALVFEKQNPPTPHEESAFTPPQWDMGSLTGDQGPSVKDWFANEDAAEAKATAAVLNEIRVGRQV